MGFWRCVSLFGGGGRSSGITRSFLCISLLQFSSLNIKIDSNSPQLSQRELHSALSFICFESRAWPYCLQCLDRSTAFLFQRQLQHSSYALVGPRETLVYSIVSQLVADCAVMAFVATCVGFHTRRTKLLWLCARIGRAASIVASSDGGLLR